MISDVEEFGPIVDRLIGGRFERSLAVNSLKLRFGTETAGPKGTHYIWIDPPWDFHGPSGLITCSDEYTDADFQAWSQLFDPINANVLTAWRVFCDDSVVFQFGSGHSLEVPSIGNERRDDDWYAHWYACERGAYHRLSPRQIDYLLEELCVRRAFCLPPADVRRLTNNPPADVDSFTDAVLRAEGMNPSSHPELRDGVRETILTHFRRAAENDLPTKEL